MLHRDLNLANLFLGHGLELKIGDFGCAEVFDNYFSYSFETVGNNLEYISPEMFQSKGCNLLQVDNWQVGICLYKMIFGETPFKYTGKRQDNHYIVKTVMNSVLNS